MRQLRYQVFVSSTFRDLQEERQAVLDAVQIRITFPPEWGFFRPQIPPPWEVIQRVIDHSDYYVLIVGRTRSHR